MVLEVMVERVLFLAQPVKNVSEGPRESSVDEKEDAMVLRPSQKSEYTIRYLELSDVSRWLKPFLQVSSSSASSRQRALNASPRFEQRKSLNKERRGKTRRGQNQIDQIIHPELRVTLMILNWIIEVILN